MLEEAYGKVLNEINHEDNSILSVQQIKNHMQTNLADVAKALEENDVHSAWLILQETVEDLEHHISNTPSDKYSNDDTTDIVHITNNQPNIKEKDSNSNIINFPRQDLP